MSKCPICGTTVHPANLPRYGGGCSDACGEIIEARAVRDAALTLMEDVARDRDAALARAEAAEAELAEVKASRERLAATKARVHDYVFGDLLAMSHDPTVYNIYRHLMRDLA